MSDYISADGSPLAFYLALPAGDAPLTIHHAIGVNASILELGSGPGRLTRVLVALGHRVTAVDDSAEMLAHVTGAETVCADLFQLTLGRRFDVVLAASHLVNIADPERRLALFRVCADHLSDGGQVIMERYEPGWLLTAGPSASQLGSVAVEYRPGGLRGDRRSAVAIYRLGEQSWTQEFEAADLDDAELHEQAEAVGLLLAGTLGEGAAWVRLVAAEPRP